MQICDEDKCECIGNSHLVVAAFIASYLLLGAVPPTLLGAVPPASTSVLRVKAHRPAAPLLAPILAGTVPLWPVVVALATAISSAALGPVPLHPPDHRVSCLALIAAGGLTINSRTI